MIKKMILCLFLLMMISPVSIMAHSVIESSNPADGSTMKQEVKSINITFNTKIEDVQQLNVTDQDGNEYTAKTTEIQDDQLTANFDPVLQNGEYTLTTKLIGADGHQVEASLSFSVQLPPEEEAEEEPSEPSNHTQPGVSEDSPDTAVENSDGNGNSNDQNENGNNTESNTDGNDAGENADQNNENNNTAWWILLVLVLIAVPAMILLNQRKKS